MNTKNLKDGTLAAPVVLNASEDDNYTIDQYDAKAGISLTVFEYTDAQADDIIKVYWGTVRSESYTVYNVTADLPLEIDILNDWPPECHADGSYDVYYEVTDRYGNKNESEHVPLIVDAGLNPGTLPAPVVPDAAPGYINYEAASDGVEVQIAYPGMAAGDVVTLVMNGYDASSDAEKFASAYAPYTVVDADVTAGMIDMTTVVTLDDMTKIGENAYALFWYSVVPKGAVNAETSISLQVTVDVVAPGNN